MVLELFIQLQPCVLCAIDNIFVIYFCSVSCSRASFRYSYPSLVFSAMPLLSSFCQGVVWMQQRTKHAIFINVLVEIIVKMSSLNIWQIVEKLSSTHHLWTNFETHRPDMRSSFNQLLAALASFDLLYLFTMLLEGVSISFFSLYYEMVSKMTKTYSCAKEICG